MKQHQPPPHEDDSVFPLEEKLGHALVKARLLSDSQLKTAFDYQHSLGGSLLEVVEKLGFVSPKALARFVADQKLKGPVQDHIPPAAPAARVE